MAVETCVALGGVPAASSSVPRGAAAGSWNATLSPLAPLSIRSRSRAAPAAPNPCLDAAVSRRTIDDLLDNHPRIRRALFWSTLVDEAILREWLVNMGRRRVDKQIAHLFCEVHARLTTVNRMHDALIPLTQEELADILGVSTVHAQRVLSQLRDPGLVTVQDSRVVVPDIGRLREIAEFNGDCLHPEQAAGGEP